MLVALVVVVLGAGCRPKAWAKPDATIEAWRRDRWECERDSQRTSCRKGNCGTYTSDELYSDCLRAHGWKLVNRDTAQLLEP